MEELLPRESFVKCHRSYLVNLKYVKIDYSLTYIVNIWIYIAFLDKVIPNNKKNKYNRYMFILIIVYIIFCKYSLDGYFRGFMFAMYLLVPMLFIKERLIKKIFWLCFYISIISTISVISILLSIFLIKIGLITSFDSIYYKEIRGWKHDIRNHFSIILGLAERNSSNEVVKYINEIEEKTNQLREVIYTDNIAVDSILSSKINLAKEKQIEIELDLNILSDIKLSNIEICTLFGNLLDNAIEACEKVEGNKFIVLQILSTEDKLIIKIKNNTNGDLKDKNGIFKTTKTSGIHGIGLSQIDGVVEKHQGYIKRIHENNIFETSIMINY